MGTPRENVRMQYEKRVKYFKLALPCVVYAGFLLLVDKFNGIIVELISIPFEIFACH